MIRAPDPRRDLRTVVLTLALGRWGCVFPGRQETVEEVLKNMFDGEEIESCILNGTQVLLTLLETRRPG